MQTPLEQYAADHRRLLETAGRVAGFADPVAVDMDEFYAPLVKAARRGELLPIDGVLVRDWDPDNRHTTPGVQIGMRDLRDRRHAFRPRPLPATTTTSTAGAWISSPCDRKDYARLYKIALRCRRDDEPAGKPPVLPQDQLDLLWKNTIGYLEGPNLERIKAYGGRAKRGVLLTGAPGNGKTMACRWIWEACRQRRWEYRLVTPDNYRSARAARQHRGPVQRRAPRHHLLRRHGPGPARPREGRGDGGPGRVPRRHGRHPVNEGVVFVFTTNCSLDLIDRAFKRPGRLDLVLHFKAPDAGLRRQLIERWHADIRAGLDIEAAVASTDGYSFAEIEELKNLLVMHFMDEHAWDWGWALKQFDINRSELGGQPERHVGFAGNGRRAVGFGRRDEEAPF